MKPAVVAFFAFILGSAAMAAQTASPGQSFGASGMEGQGQSSLAVLKMEPIARGCPVALRADHGASGNLLKVDKARPKGMAQLLYLTLTNPDARQLVGARVRVHGLSGKARITQTLENKTDADVAQTLEVKFSPGPGKQVFTNVWIAGMAAVVSIDLDSVTYADGSTWNFTGRDACHVTPNPLMLIAAH